MESAMALYSEELLIRLNTWETVDEVGTRRETQGNRRLGQRFLEMN